VLVLSGLRAYGAQPSRPFGDSRVIAPVPFPGYPEGIVVSKGKIYVSGPAAFGINVPSTIHVYDLDTGTFLQDITIQGQPAFLKALSCITADKEGNLYVVDAAQGILKIDPKTLEQTTYASGFHPVYTSPYAQAPMLLNDLAFDKKGNLYVTDSFQATIWRVPPGGGTAQVWYQSPIVDGIFGPNGVRVDDSSDKLYFVVSLRPTGEGYVYTLPLVDTPTDADLQTFHTFAPGEVPDGVAFGKSGKLYVALAGSSQIAVLRPDGSEEVRLNGPAGTLPWANPANIAFNDKEGTLLVTNHASLTGLPDPSPLFAIFDVVVNDTAGKLFGQGVDQHQ
jgi:sugar lactone lactonase YvrE